MRTLPGTTLLRLARDWFEESTVSGILEPLVADSQREWIDARGPGARRRARARMWLALAAVLLRCTPRLAVAPAPRGSFRTAASILLTFAALGCGLNLLLWDLPGTPARGRLESWLYLGPSLLVYSIGFGMLPLSLWLAARGTRDRLERLAVLRLALGVMALIAVAGGFLVPWSNQQFRTIVFDEYRRAGLVAATSVGPSRGAAELTTWELFAPEPLPPDSVVSPRDAAAERRDRLALPLIPGVLALLGWRLGRSSRRRPRFRGLFWWAVACAAQVGIRGASLGSGGELWWSDYAAWLPLVIFALLAILAGAGAGTADCPDTPRGSTGLT